MKKSKFEDRARAINGSKFVQQEIPKDVDLQKYWEKNVRCKEDVKSFYQTFYPHFPEVLINGLADYIDRQVTGQIPVSAEFNKNSDINKARKEAKWDVEAEIEEQRIEGLMNLTRKRLDELL